VEASILRLAQQPVEDMAHLVEECNHIVVPHQRRLVRGGFGQVRNHGSERVAALAVGKIVAGEERPYRSMGVFGGYPEQVLDGFISDLCELTNREGRGRDSSIQQSRTRPLHLFPKQRIAEPLNKLVRYLLVIKAPNVTNLDAT
jgi:hypothetical protein